MSFSAVSGIRPMIPEDIPDVVSIENAVSEAPWTAGIFQDCLRLNYFNFVLENAEQIIGFLIVMMVGPECHLMNVGVAADRQRQGYGQQLIRYLIELMQEKKASRIYLEVRVSNHAAIALYEGVGFTYDGLRKDYYRAADGREDGLLYSLNLL